MRGDRVARGLLLGIDRAASRERRRGGRRPSARRRGRARRGRRPSARFTAVGRGRWTQHRRRRRARPRRIRSSSSAIPYAAATPISGAPRIASRWIAAATSCALRSASSRSAHGSSVWSSALKAHLAVEAKGLAQRRELLQPVLDRQRREPRRPRARGRLLRRRPRRAPSGCWSSPDWYISVMMSQPPTSSPSTNSCGIVGQFESAESSWRIRGSGSTSTAANGWPTDCRIATVRAEKPHAGCSGVPFMNRITWFSEIASADLVAHGVGALVAHTSLTPVGLDRQCVDAVAELVAEHVIHEPVLGDPAEALERGRRDDRVEVVPVAGDLGAGAGIPASIRCFSSSGVRRHSLRVAAWPSLYWLKHDHTDR